MAALARRIAIAILLAGLAALAAASALAAPDPREAPATSWEVRLGAPGDPGEPFEMTGTVREEDGRAVRGRKVFVYHADTHGQYAERDGPMRFAGTLRTDSLGRYRVRTVFPGGYGGYAAHVHFEVLEPTRVAGFFNVQQEGRSTGRGFVAKRGRDGVWRLQVDLQPRRTDPNSGDGFSRPMRQLAPELWYPPKRDTTRTGPP
jgi:hypothetical protein